MASAGGRTTGTISSSAASWMPMRSPFGLVARHAALNAEDHQVPDSHIGEGPAYHHLVISSTGAVAVEVLCRDAVLAQVTGR